MTSAGRIFPSSHPLLTLILLALLVSCTGNRSSLSVAGTTVEYMPAPQGLDDPDPRFAWTLDSPERGAAQSAYRIVVAREEGTAARGEGDIWDTGKVASDQTLNIRYAGPPLESGETYFWSVRVWDAADQPSAWSEPKRFMMGILDAAEWQADWITHPDSSVSAPLLRQEFSVRGDIASARVFVSGAGYYELYLNGEKVGDHVLDPAVTDPRKRMLYATYDVTDQVREGENAWGLWLGNGALRIKAEEGRWTWWRMDNRFGTPMGLAQLQVKYADGSEDVFTTDDSWSASSSPITYNNVYGGEEYDARREWDGWNEIKFYDADWVPAEVVERPDLILDAQTMPPIRVVETLEPRRETRPAPDTWLYDLEQNIPGWWRLRVEGADGTVVKVRGAETLNDELFPKPLEAGDTLSTDKIYHRDVWTTYTLKGEGVETYEPRFFYSGFRYIEVQVDEPGQLESLAVEGRVVHSDVRRNGHFASSDSLLNRIYEAAIWSQRGNLHGYPEDCPHREKGGYNGDGQVIAETSLHDFHMHALYAKWLNDMRDAQFENGRIPNTSPTVLGGMGGGIAWGSAYILLPWWMYQYYEDVDLLEEHYGSMRRYMEYLRQLAAVNDEAPEEEFIINEFGGFWDSLGEWEAPVGERTGPVNPLTNTYYWYLNVLTFAEIAGVLGREEDRAEHLALAERIKEAFNEKFFLSDLDLYGTEEVYQGYLLFALNGGLVPEGHREAVLDNLIHDIMVVRDGHLGTGILGTKHLMNVLPAAGREDVLHRVVTRRTEPSWGYWIDNGATTLWEAWDAGNSHNHQMFGTVNEYFYKYLAGIRAPTHAGTSAGYATIRFQPYLPDGMDRAEASVETVRGRVASRWEKTDDGLQVEVEVPVGSTATVAIPVQDPAGVTVAESGVVVWEDGDPVPNEAGISKGRVEDGLLVLEVTSGSFTFAVHDSS